MEFFLDDVHEAQHSEEPSHPSELKHQVRRGHFSNDHLGSDPNILVNISNYFYFFKFIVLDHVQVCFQQGLCPLQ